LIIKFFFIIQKMYFIYKTNLITSQKNQQLLFAQGGCLEEKIDKKIRGAPWTNMWEVACYFEYKFLKFDNEFVFIIQTMYFIYTINLITFQKNQFLLFVKGGCLEEKIGRNIRGVPRKNMWEVACYFEYKFLNFDNQFFLSSKRCTSYIPQIWLQVRKINPYYLHKVAGLKKKIWRQIRGAPREICVKLLATLRTSF